MNKERVATFGLQLREKVVPLSPILKSGCSAVGSALRSGRRGRAFESPHPDTKKPIAWKCDGLFVFQLSVMCSTSTSSLRKRLALSRNLVADSVVRYWQVPPRVSRDAISGWR